MDFFSSLSRFNGLFQLIDRFVSADHVELFTGYVPDIALVCFEEFDLLFQAFVLILKRPVVAQYAVAFLAEPENVHQALVAEERKGGHQQDPRYPGQDNMFFVAPGKFTPHDCKDYQSNREKSRIR